MNTFFIVVIFISIFVTAIAAYLIFKYGNPYKLYMVFGKKGSGKTTYMAKQAYIHIKRGWTVYSNVYIGIPGVRVLDTTKLGVIAIPQRSVLLIDEVGLVWDNRDYAKFPQHVKSYFKYQRQYKHKVYLFSQTFDVDKKIRDLTDALYLCTCPFPGISVVRKIKRFVTLVQPDNTSEGRIADGLEFVPIIFQLFGVDCIKITRIGRWTKYFKSYNPPPLRSGPTAEYVSADVSAGAERTNEASQD